MQAFLWRHLVPAAELQALVYSPSAKPPPKRAPPSRPAITETNAAAAASSAEKPKFTRQQVEWRLRQLKLLYEENLLTDDFYTAKVAECDAAR